MIRVRLHGRLGNQLFQYAFAVYAAQKLNTKFVVEVRQKDGFQLGYFNLPSPLSILSQGKFLSRLYNLYQRRFKTSKTFYIPGWDEDWSNRTLTDNTEYRGYFQDARFSFEIKSLLLSHLTIKKKYADIFNDSYPFALTEPYAVMHVRLGDYVGQETKVNNSTIKWMLPDEWYYKALQSAGLGTKRLVIISDDMNTVRKKFAGASPNIFFPEGDMITHFQFLLHADTGIISNSSYSWWGAFLNQQPGKKIIAPDNWVGYNAGFEYPKGIMHNEFDWV